MQKGLPNMKLFLRLAWRNIWRHRRRTLLVVLAIGLTMMMMLWYDGLIAGFNQSIAANAVKIMGGNIQVHAPDYYESMDVVPLLPVENDQEVVRVAEARPQVVTASRRINTSGMVTSSEGAFGVSIVGIEPDKEILVNLVAQNLSSGRFLNADDQDVVFIGQALADAMGVQIGDRIALVGQATHKQMRNRTMTVIGIYDVGIPEVERGSVFISLKEAQDLYDLSGQVTEINVFLKNLGPENAVIAAMKKQLNGYAITSWETNYPELVAAFETKGAVMNIFSIIILFIAGIGILNLLLMAVFERTREIGVLGAMGLRPGQISLLFLLEGAMMGLVGLVFGVGLGLLLNGILSKVGMDFSAFTSMTEYTALITGRVYTTLGVDKLLGRSLTVIIISLLASFIPAREAAQNEPAESLHYV
jgi:ABC-type lipoprotein release transport system permease subunit